MFCMKRKTCHIFCITALSLLVHGRHSGFTLQQSSLTLCSTALCVATLSHCLHGLALFLQQAEHCVMKKESSMPQKKRESITMQSQRRSDTLQSHSHKANQRALQCDAKTKRATMQQKNHCVAALFVFASHCNALTLLCIGGFASQCFLKLITKKKGCDQKS